MTKDLAILISDKTPYLTTDEYLDAVDAELKKQKANGRLKKKRAATIVAAFGPHIGRPSKSLIHFRIRRARV